MAEMRWIVLFGFVAVIGLAAVVGEAFLGLAWAGAVVGTVGALFFGPLAVFGLRSGEVWIAEWGGRGPIKILRSREPLWYWIGITVHALMALFFASQIII